jgi:hypothetical protein
MLQIKLLLILERIEVRPFTLLEVINHHDESHNHSYIFELKTKIVAVIYLKVLKSIMHELLIF